MTTQSRPRAVAELQDFVRGNALVHARGNGSKSGLHQAAADIAIADLSLMRGIVEYQPAEFTLSARAGSPIAELKAALAAEGQYLPFDPLLPERATIGGTVAANLSGSRRYRYGGLRDFILGASVVDGGGRAYTVGGKVVKNAAGFDLSKFLVGSLGQYAIMTELTFKVFPDAPHFSSLRLRYQTLDAALAAIFFLNQSIFELDALDLLPAADGWSLLARLGGRADALPPRLERLRAALQSETAPQTAEEVTDTARLWQPLRQLDAAFVAKVVLPPKRIPALERGISGCQRRYSCGGNIAWVATEDIAALDRALAALGLAGLCLQGDCEKPLWGKAPESILSARVKAALDPDGKLV